MDEPDRGCQTIGKTRLPVFRTATPPLPLRPCPINYSQGLAEGSLVAEAALFGRQPATSDTLR